MEALFFLARIKCHWEISTFLPIFIGFASGFFVVILPLLNDSSRCRRRNCNTRPQQQQQQHHQKMLLHVRQPEWNVQSELRSWTHSWNLCPMSLWNVGSRVLGPYLNGKISGRKQFQKVPSFQIIGYIRIQFFFALLWVFFHIFLVCVCVCLSPTSVSAATRLVYFSFK